MPDPVVTLESLAAEVSYIKSALHELLNRVPGRMALPEPTPPPVQTYGRFPGGPQVLEVAPGIHVRLVAPVCPGWEPGFYAGIFGKDHNPNDDFVPFAAEPSNANADQPPRSASGYPLMYRNDGTVWLMNADGLFQNEAQVEAERAERAARNAQSKAEWGSYRPG